MTARRALRVAGAAALLALLAPRPARAQVSASEVPEYRLSGSALLSYTGAWERLSDRLLATHQLTEGLSLSLSGWIYESRFVKFRTYLLALELDSLGDGRGRAHSLGYGGSLQLLSGSILPVTLSYARGLAVNGSTLQPAAVSSTTLLGGYAQLVSPLLPRAEVRGQRVVQDDPGGRRTTTDSALVSTYGASALHRYSAVGSWQDLQYAGQPRITQTLASITDDAYLSQDTRASFGGTLSRSTGLGGTGDDAFTSYQASASLFTRLSPATLVRGRYGFATNTGPDREQSQNQGSIGSTINLRPIPILLGEGLAGTSTRFVAPGLDRTIEAVTASQGVATSGRWGRTSASLAATGQAGYASVSDGVSGALYGYGANAGLQRALRGWPLRTTAFYTFREDRSSAGNSLRSYGALASSDVSRFYPLFLLPVLSYTHVEQNAFFATPLPGASATSTLSTTRAENDTFTGTLTGTSPLWRTRLTFAGGYVDSSSSSSGSHVRQVFGRAADAFRVGPGTYGNLSLDASHQLGQGTHASALLSLVWSFRESTLSLTYSYALALPQGSSTHSLALLFTRTFDTSFLPESR